MSSQFTALKTLWIKECIRFTRIWVQTLVPPAITMSLYFVIFGGLVLPKSKKNDSTRGADTMSYFEDVYGLNYKMYEVVVTDHSELIGMTLDDIEDEVDFELEKRKVENDNVLRPDFNKDNQTDAEEELENKGVIIIEDEEDDKDEFMSFAFDDSLYDEPSLFEEDLNHNKIFGEIHDEDESHEQTFMETELDDYEQEFSHDTDDGEEFDLEELVDDFREIDLDEFEGDSHEFYPLEDENKKKVPITHQHDVHDKEEDEEEIVIDDDEQ